QSSIVRKDLLSRQGALPPRWSRRKWIPATLLWFTRIRSFAIRSLPHPVPAGRAQFLGPVLVLVAFASRQQPFLGPQPTVPLHGSHLRAPRPLLAALPLRRINRRPLLRRRR